MRHPVDVRTARAYLPCLPSRSVRHMSSTFTALFQHSPLAGARRVKLETGPRASEVSRASGIIGSQEKKSRRIYRSVKIRASNEAHALKYRAAAARDGTSAGAFLHASPHTHFRLCYRGSLLFDPCGSFDKRDG